MAGIIRPGDGFLYMKVGTHARESLEEIIARKTKEIEDAGYAMWGYGGNTCHPVTMVQPFARTYEERAGAIYLCMQPIESKHFAEPLRATKCSTDGMAWEEIPAAVNVRGSRYALVIQNLRQEAFDVSLAHSSVAVGHCAGRAGDSYVQGRVDKACLEAGVGIDITDNDSPDKVHIGLVARIVKPYAVFVKD